MLQRRGREGWKKWRGEDGEGLKSDIKRTHLSKVQISSLNRDQARHLSCWKTSTQVILWIWWKHVHIIINMCRNKCKEESAKHFHPLPQTLNPATHLNRLHWPAEEQEGDADGFFNLTPGSQKKRTLTGLRLCDQQKGREKRYLVREWQISKATDSYSTEKRSFHLSSGFWDEDENSFKEAMTCLRSHAMWEVASAGHLSLLQHRCKSFCRGIHCCSWEYFKILKEWYDLHILRCSAQHAPPEDKDDIYSTQT